MKALIFAAAVLAYLVVGIVVARFYARRDRRRGSTPRMYGEYGFIAAFWPFVAGFDLLDRIARGGRP